MKYKGLLVIALTCALLLMSVSAEAATGKRIATAGAMELLIPVGARSTALGGSNIAAVTGIDAAYWNPAGVAAVEGNGQAIFSHLKWIGDIDVNYLAAAAQLGAFGSLGVSVKTLSFGDIVQTTVDNPDGNGTIFSPSYLTFNMTYSRKMTDRILFGANAKIISEKILGTSASGIGFDFGLQYVSPASGIKLGVVLTNFGGNMRFSGNELEARVALPGTEAGTTVSSVSVPVAEFDLPSQLKLGIAYDIGVAENNDLTVMGSFVNNAYAYDQYIVGGEYNFNDFVFLRGSYALAYKEGLEGQSDKFVTSSEDFLFGPSFGGGIKLGVGTNMSLLLDYTYQTTEFFNDNQWFSLTFAF